MIILGIESSCDDTSAAVIRDGVLLSNVTASQAVHEAYGGVVPELASRAHQQNIVPVVDQALNKAGIECEELSAIAFTRGPGLMGSLLVGVSFAKGLAASLDIPMIEVNHLQGHILEGGGGAVPQLQGVDLIVNVNEGSGTAGEGGLGIGGLAGRLYLGFADALTATQLLVEPLYHVLRAVNRQERLNEIRTTGSAGGVGYHIKQIIFCTNTPVFICSNN